MPLDVETWLRSQCADYSFDARGILEVRGDQSWPLVADSEASLVEQLRTGGHLLPLPKEPAALANVLEVSIVDFLLRRIDDSPGATAVRGTERGYPDLELAGSAFGGGFHAVDIKIAQRKRVKRPPARVTQSRVTLYTGNTYFRYPTLLWPGTMRPFADYSSHLDVVGVYTLNDSTAGRVDDLEPIVQPPWKIGSRQRSSTTREYIGGVVDIAALRDGRGEFESEAAFYTFWRKYPFRIGRAVQQQLDKLVPKA